MVSLTEKKCWLTSTSLSLARTSMVMAVANVWLMGTLRGRRGLRTNFIAEEGWDLVGGPGGRVFQRNSKLARGLGLSNIAALHHIADIPADDPAIAMFKEAQTIHLFRQGTTEDIEAVAREGRINRPAPCFNVITACGNWNSTNALRPDCLMRSMRASVA